MFHVKLRKSLSFFYSFQLKDRAEFLEYVQVFPTDAIKDGPFFFMQMANLKLGFLN